MSLESRKLITDRSTLLDTGYNHIWCKEVPIYSKYYPSFAIIDHPSLKKSELEALHVKFLPVTLATLRLHKERKNISTDVRSGYRRQRVSVSDGHSLLNTNRLREQLVLEYTMLKKILGWIEVNTPPNHQPTVSFTIKNSFSYPGCTYCLALSYWLKLRAYQRIAFRYSYPHCSADYVAPELLPSMLNACDLQLGNTKLHKKPRDALYLRSLEVSFTALHKALARLRNKSTHQSHVHAAQFESYSEPLEVPEQYYRIFSSDNVHQIGYIYDSPLQHYSPSTLHDPDDDTDSATCAPHDTGYFPTTVNPAIDAFAKVSQNLDPDTYCWLLNTMVTGVNFSPRNRYAVTEWMLIHDTLKYFRFSLKESDK
ncbi:MAG: hypothetical protein Q8K97_03035 [Pseudohongiella sp.]|nr:hypothetical protein [Pseudohongiella sp.]